MEYNQPLDSDFQKTLSINGEIREFLKETAKWAQFIAIVGLIFMGLFLIMLLFIGSMFSYLGRTFGMPELGEAGGLGMLGGIGMFINACLLALFIFPLVYLLRFAQNTKAALKSDNQEALTVAFQNLKSHYKFYGIFLAIFVGIYGVIFLFSLLMGAAAMMMS